MTSWTIADELRQPAPRKVKTTGAFKTTVGMILIGTVFIIALWFFFLFPMQYNEVERILTLNHRGVAIEGKVTGTHEVVGSKFVSYYVDYSFVTQGDINNSGSLIFSNAANISYGDYSRYIAGQSVPIIYDPVNPRNSTLNWGDWVHKNPTSPVRRDAAILIIFIPPFFLLSKTFWTYRKERRLIMMGSATSAKITSEREYITRGMRLLAITYTFIDNQHMTISGKRGSLPLRSNIRSCGLDNPTVLYDPQNSSRNMFYPGRYAVALEHRE